MKISALIKFKNAKQKVMSHFKKAIVLPRRQQLIFFLKINGRDYLD